MPATVIPVTGLNLGFVGQVSQQDFSIRTARQVNPTDTKSIAFGEATVLNANNTYSSVAQFITGGGTFTASIAIGIAVADTKTNVSFPAAGSNGAAMPGGVYAPGNEADVATIGTVNVVINNGTPPGAGSPVYVRKLANGSIPAGVVGGFEAVADTTNTVAYPNLVFKTGIVGADGTAQVTMLVRQMP
jgi:hypothetical protein